MLLNSRLAAVLTDEFDFMRDVGDWLNPRQVLIVITEQHTSSQSRFTAFTDKSGLGDYYWRGVERIPELAGRVTRTELDALTPRIQCDFPILNSNSDYGRNLLIVSDSKQFSMVELYPLTVGVMLQSEDHCIWD